MKITVPYEHDQTMFMHWTDETKVADITGQSWARFALDRASRLWKVENPVAKTTFIVLADASDTRKAGQYSFLGTTDKGKTPRHSNGSSLMIWGDTPTPLTVVNGHIQGARNSTLSFDGQGDLEQYAVLSLSTNALKATWIGYAEAKRLSEQYRRVLSIAGVSSGMEGNTYSLECCIGRKQCQDTNCDQFMMQFCAQQKALGIDHPYCACFIEKPELIKAIGILGKYGSAKCFYGPCRDEQYAYKTTDMRNDKCSTNITICENNFTAEDIEQAKFNNVQITNDCGPTSKETNEGPGQQTTESFAPGKEPTTESGTKPGQEPTTESGTKPEQEPTTESGTKPGQESTESGTKPGQESTKSDSPGTSVTSPTGMSTGALIGAIAGGICLLVIIIVIILRYKRQK